MIGVKISNSPNVSVLSKIKTVVDEAIKTQINQYDGSLNYIHDSIYPEQINPLRLNIFKSLNNPENNIYELIWELAGDEIESILGPDILVQNKINFSLQTPGDNASILDPHSDCWSGDTPFQINLWIPLTDVYSTNSMFLFDIEKTKHSIDKLNRFDVNKSLNLNEDISINDFVTLKFGNFLIFNPGLIHGNVVNQTPHSRASINVRFKSLFAPNPDSEHMSRSPGIFFKPLKLSPWTDLAVKLDKYNSNF